MKKLEKNVIKAAKAELKKVEEALSNKKNNVSTSCLSWLLEDIYFKYDAISNAVDTVKAFKTVSTILLFLAPAVWMLIQKYPQIVEIFIK